MTPTSVPTTPATASHLDWSARDQQLIDAIDRVVGDPVASEQIQVYHMLPKLDPATVRAAFAADSEHGTDGAPVGRGRVSTLLPVVPPSDSPRDAARMMIGIILSLSAGAWRDAMTRGGDAERTLAARALRGVARICLAFQQDVTFTAPSPMANPRVRALYLAALSVMAEQAPHADAPMGGADGAPHVDVASSADSWPELLEAVIVDAWMDILRGEPDASLARARSAVEALSPAQRSREAGYLATVAESDRRTAALHLLGLYTWAVATRHVLAGIETPAEARGAGFSIEPLMQSAAHYLARAMGSEYDDLLTWLTLAAQRRLGPPS